MVGFPKELKTKQDWINAASYAASTGDGKAALKKRLSELKSNTSVLVLKAASASKDPEEQTEADFEMVDDLACEKLRLGFTDQEIDQLVEVLK
jgi:hypothetical protein